MKECKKCESLKELSEFYKSKYSKDGHDRICNVCRRKYRKDHYHNNIETQREISRINAKAAYRKDPEKFKKRNRNYDKDKIKGYRDKSRYNQLFRALEIYGFDCDSCSILKLFYLEWHHIKGNKEKEKHSKMIKRIVDENSRLDDIQLLCANCHIDANIRDKTKLYSGLLEATKRLYP